MGLALSHLQRQAIRQDPAWRDGHYTPDNPPTGGLALARALAMCSYKSAELFDERYGRKPNRGGEDPGRSHEDRFEVGGYLDYQGQLFLKRFDANSYLAVSRAMDTFDLGTTAADEAATLRRILGRVWMVGISSDWLFPPGDVQSLAERMVAAGADARYVELASTHGHDGFLADAGDLAPIISEALHEERLSVAR
jgi:homoserine O-acetyltransferase